MRKYNIWPIFTDDNFVLSIKNKRPWLSYNYGFKLIILIAITIVTLLLLLIFILKNKNIYIYPDLDIYIYNNRSIMRTHIYRMDNTYIRDIYNYTLELNQDLLNFRLFWRHYNFLHLYLNLLIKDPLNLVRGYSHLFIYLNNNLFDNSFFRLLLDLDSLKYPKHYWYFILGKKFSPYYLWEAFHNTIPTYGRLPRFVWYWTHDWNPPNYKSTLLLFFPRKDHRMIIIMEMYRPWIYFHSLYVLYLHLSGTIEYFVNKVDFVFFTEWGYFWGVSEFGKFTQWFHLNSAKLVELTLPYKKPWVLTGMKAIPFPDEFTFRYAITSNYDYYLRDMITVFFPKVVASFIHNIYLPVYLPVDSFNQWISHQYTNFGWLLQFSADFYTRFLTLNEFNITNLMLKEYLKQSYTFVEMNFVVEYYVKLCQDILIHSQRFYFSYIRDVVDFDLVFLQFKLGFAEVKKTPLNDWYGLWSLQHLRFLFLYFIAYIWMLRAFINHWRPYWFKDSWLFTILWYNPTYLWNIFEIHIDLEHDYMLSVEYLKKFRLKTYMNMYFRMAQALYIYLGFDLMNSILRWFDIYLGFADFLAGPITTQFSLLFYSWIVYVCIPVLFLVISMCLNSVLVAMFTRLKLLYPKYSVLSICYILFLNYVEKQQIINNLSNNSPVKNVYANLNRYSALHLSGFRSSKSYWSHDVHMFFDLSPIRISGYNNNRLNKRVDYKLQQQLLQTSRIHMKFYNLSWKTVQINHYYKYYDYGDFTRYSNKKLSDF